MAVSIGDRTNLLELSLPELIELLQSLGELPFRAKQVYEWIFRRQAASFEEMTNLPKGLRERLAEIAALDLVRPIAESRSKDNSTTKILFELRDGMTVEAVLMRYGTRWRTVCISTQVGCAVGCPFCATGQGGFLRNLSCGEMVAQVLYLSRSEATATGDEKPITKVVFMGQGEPLLNLEATWKAVEQFNSPYGLNIGARHITISTSGVVPGIEELARRDLQVGLAVSLHAPDDELRDRLVPLNKKYPLARLIQACHYYVQKTGRRITFEYVLIDDVNDSLKLARQTAALLQGLLCHVNLVPLNPTAATWFRRPPLQKILAFEGELRKRGIPTTVRAEKGTDIDAACGQLKVRIRDEAGQLHEKFSPKAAQFLPTRT